MPKTVSTPCASRNAMADWPQVWLTPLSTAPVVVMSKGDPPARYRATVPRPAPVGNRRKTRNALKATQPATTRLRRCSGSYSLKINALRRRVHGLIQRCHQFLDHGLGHRHGVRIRLRVVDLAAPDIASAGALVDPQADA